MIKYIRLIQQNTNSLFIKRLAIKIKKALKNMTVKQTDIMKTIVLTVSTNTQFT